MEQLVDNFNKPKLKIERVKMKLKGTKNTFNGCETHFHKWGECMGWSPMTPNYTPTLGIALIWESQMFKTLVGKGKKHQIRHLEDH